MTFLRDLGYAVRSLSRSPALSAALLATVAIGVGTHAALAGFINGLVATELVAPAPKGVVTAGVAAPAARADVRSLDEAEIQAGIARVRRLLWWAAEFVFVTAASNVAAFLLSRAWKRSHETAARVALGATGRHLAQQILAEALIVAAAGGALGGLVGFWTASAFPALLFAGDAARLHLALSAGRTASSVAAYSVLMVLCALAPLLRVRQHGVLSILRRTGGTQVTSAGGMRSALVVAQVAVSCVLIVGSVSLFQGFRRSLRTARAGGLGEPIVAILDADAGYGRPDLGAEYFQRAKTEVLRVPAVASVAWVSTPPGSRTVEQRVRFEPPAQGYREVSVDTRAFPSGREVTAMTLKAGRFFGGQDGPGTCRVAIVNAALADRYFDGDALGRAMQDAAGRRVDIVGVVTHAHDTHPGPIVYLFERQGAMPAEGGHERYRLRDGGPPSPPVNAGISVASPEYFAAVGATILAGQVFASDGAADGCDTAVINREGAETFFAGHAVGGAVVDPDGHRAEIVGVADAGPLRVTGRRTEPTVFYPLSQHYVSRMTLIAGATDASADHIALIQRRLQAVAGGSPVRPVVSLEEYLVHTSLGPERIASALVGTSAGVALGLAVLGMYGVMADAVLQRKREIAVRLALGAAGWRIMGGVLRDGLRIAAVGVACGMAASWLALRGIGHVTPGFAVTAWWTWLASPVALLALVALASVAPARYALAIDPLTLTRDE